MKSKKNSFLIFILCLSAAIFNGYFFNFINQKSYQYSSNENGLSEFTKNEKFIIIIIIAPIVETILFSLIPNLTLTKIKIRNNFILVIVPSILFSICHLYNLVYALMALFAGVIINWYYIFSKNSGKSAFWLVVLLHTFYNLYGYVFVN